MKFSFDLLSGFREEDVENNDHVHACSPKTGTWGQIFSQPLIIC